MRKLVVLFALMIALGQWGCQFLGGSASENNTPVSGYDSNSHYQMNQLEEDIEIKEYLVETTRFVRDR